VIEATPEDAIVRNGHHDHWSARTWTRGKVDDRDAIHPITPDLTQGACQAIVDATTLPSVWRRRATPERRCANYQRRRGRNAARTTLLARSSRGIGQWDRRLICTARDAALRHCPSPSSCANSTSS
jgi:2-polyprenyl-6-methoxyphenol hydroxylase-like FAD-dependent oxidoreductase